MSSPLERNYGEASDYPYQAREHGGYGLLLRDQKKPAESDREDGIS